MDLSRLNQLKTVLCEAKEFNLIMHAFYDILDQPGFSDCFVEVLSPDLEKQILSVGKAIFRKHTVKLKQSLYLRIDEYKFQYARAYLEGRPMSAIYFEDIDKGLICVAMEGGGTQFARITRKMVPKDFADMN